VTLDELARRLDCRLEGDGTLEVARVAGIEHAGPGDVTFLANARYASRVLTTRATAIIANDDVPKAPCAILRTPQVYLAFARAVGIQTPPVRPAAGINGLASIDPGAAVGPGVSIAPFAVVGAGATIGARTIVHAHAVIEAGARIGDDCEIHAHVSIREGVVIGRRVIIQNGAVIGSDGFGFARRQDGSHEKIPQVGRVVIEDDVEIGANAAIDRPAVGDTRIGAGTKIDNLVQVAHGVQLGRNVLLAAQSGIAGSTTLGDGVIMAGQSGATGHITLGAGAIVGAKSAVTKDVAPASHVAGVPAVDVAEWREATVLVRRLPELRRAVAALDARLAALEALVSRDRAR
jgi:UDP-3-O-[3-hydroxymyristoyl] glucosamine N-acyltransferase